MAEQLKIVIIGPFNAGKTTFVRTLSKLTMTTERGISEERLRAKKHTTTVAMDFGLVDLGEGWIVRLFGTPGQKRFSFMWRVISEGMHGYILMVDSSDRESIIEAEEIYREFRKDNPYAPHIVAANKQDIPSSLPPEDIRFILGVPDEVPVVPTIAMDPERAWNTLRSILAICLEGKLDSA